MTAMLTHDTMSAAQRAAAERLVRQVTRVCRGPLPAEARAQVNAHLAAGELEEAKAVDAGARPGCGQDVNEFICAAPFNGQEERYTCRCGHEGSFRAPAFTVEELEAEIAAASGTGT